MRLFIALNFPAALRDAVHAAAAPLRLAAPSARWTRPDKVHLTLEFLGEQPGSLVAQLTPVLDRIAERHRAITLVLREFDAFPNLRRPRVVWAGMEASSELTELRQDVGEACAALGLPREERAFRPHVTLGRIGPRTARGEIDALARSAPTVAIDATAVVRTLDLMESAGGRYVTVHAAALGRRRSSRP